MSAPSRFTEDARKVLALARKRSTPPQPEDILIALIQTPKSGLGHDILIDFGFTVADVRRAMKDTPPEPGHQRYDTLIGSAWTIVGHRGDKQIGTEHLLYGLTCITGPARHVLADKNLTRRWVSTYLNRRPSHVS